MPLQDQELAVAFGGGLDKKTDPKAVIAGSFLLLENGVFTEAHQVAKRYGYDSITNKTYSSYIAQASTLSSPKMLKSYNSELVCTDQGRLWSYSPTLGAWIDKGPYESIASLQQNTVLSNTPSVSTGPPYLQSSAILNNYLLLTWVQNSAYAAVIDNSTSTKVLPATIVDKPTSLGSATIQPVVLGGTSLAVVYVDSNDHLSVKILNTSGNTISFGAPVTISTDINHGTASTSWANRIPLAVAPTATGAVVAYGVNATTLKLVTINTSAAVVNTQTITTGKFPVQIQLVVNSTDNRIWVYWNEFTLGSLQSVLYYSVLSSTLVSALGRTLIIDFGANHELNTFGAVADTVTQQTIIYSSRDVSGARPLQFPATASKVLTSGGSVSASTFTSYGVNPLSAPFYVGTKRYAYLLLTQSDQPTVYLVNIDTSYSLTTTVTGVSVGSNLQGVAQYAINSYLEALPSVTQLGTSIYGIHAAYLTSSETTPVLGTVTYYASTLVKSDFNSSDANQAIIANNELVLNGGALQLYDGVSVAELSYSALPVAEVSIGGSGGNLADGSYTAYVAFKWYDNQGNLHQISSTPTELTLSGGGGTGAITAHCYPPIFTAKDPSFTNSITVQLYVTATNGTGAFLGSENQISVNPSGATFVTLSSGSVDSAIEVSTPLYTNGNVLANDPPPPSMLLTAHNNRVWAVDSTFPFNIYYSKSTVPTLGISFSGNLLAEIDAKGGPIGASAELDEKLILFKTGDKVAVLYGDGANDTGLGSTLSNPQFLQTDVGCSISKSILSQPNGILFKSAKGWYLLDRSTQITYIGFPVESYNTQDVTSAIRIKDKTLCVFLTSSGSALAYDYFFNKWSTFTNHTGYSADTFQDLYTYVRTDGSIYQQNTTSYLDNATSYLLKARTSWLTPAKIQGFQRVKRVLNLGDHLSPATGHGVQISAAYDFVETFSTPVLYTFPDTGGVYQYREILARQKCDTISLLIEEVSASAGQTGEYIDFTDLGFLAGIKKGPNKLPASKSVG